MAIDIIVELLDKKEEETKKIEGRLNVLQPGKRIILTVNGQTTGFNFDDFNYKITRIQNHKLSYKWNEDKEIYNPEWIENARQIDFGYDD